MATEVWFRNPDLYIRECVEELAFNIAWDRGYASKKRIDVPKFMDMYVPAEHDYRVLMIGDQGAAEIRRGRDMSNPVAVYPVWDGEMDDMLTLEEMLAHPVSDDPRYVGDMALPPDERPIEGQEHRVVVANLPLGNSGIGKKFFRMLGDMQAEYPDAIVHVHGLYGYQTAFGRKFGSVDIEPRTLASKGKVSLPMGKEVTYEQTTRFPQWVTLLGFKPVELTVPRNRCMYNMRSARWAGEHWDENLKFKASGRSEVDPDDPDAKPATSTTIVKRGTKVEDGDKFLCNTCSLRSSCKYFRTGEVCSIPGSEPAKLANFFNSRNPDAIIDGLGVILAASADRLERGITEEQEYGGKDGALDPEVTKLTTAIFANGEKLAKLIDPKRFATAKVAVQVNNAGAVGSGSTQSLVAKAYAELAGRGFTPEQITPDLIARMLNPDAAIEAQAVELNE